MKKEKELSFTRIWTVALEGISQDLTSAIKTVFLFCFGLASLQFVLTYGPMIMLPKPIDETLLIIQRCLEVLWGIALAIVYSMIVPFAVYHSKGHYKNLSVFDFISKHFKLVTIETVRTLPVIILYSLLLVIPGLVKMIRLIFVQFIVQLYKPYKDGKVDALKKSDELTQGALAGLASFYFGTQLIIALVVMGVPSLLQRYFSFEPGSLENLTIDFIFNVPIGVTIELGAAVGVLKVFEHIVAVKEGKHELAF